MIKKYKKKPIVVEAVQWTGRNDTEVLEFLENSKSDYDYNGKEIYIETLEGKMFVSDGDFVIKGVKGECYPCKPNIFEQTYDEVQE